MEVCHVVQKCFILKTMDYKQGVFKHNVIKLRCPKNPNNIILSIKLKHVKHSTFVNAIQQYFKTKQWEGHAYLTKHLKRRKTLSKNWILVWAMKLQIGCQAEFLSCFISYLASNLILYLKTVWKMQYKWIENCHVENVVLGKEFDLGVTSSLFHVFTH